MTIKAVKARIEQIDDGQFLAQVVGSNTDGEKHGNLGKVCDSIDEALDYVREETKNAIKMLVEATGTLPGTEPKKAKKKG